MALDAQGIQNELDAIEAQYQAGLIMVTEKLEAMIDLVEAHINSHIAGIPTWNPMLSSYDKAERQYRLLKRIERFKNRLELFV